MSTTQGELELGLGYATPAGWAERVLERPCELLSDHAQCELGAANAAQSTIQRYPQHTGLVERLAKLAIEELQHFRIVLELLHGMGGELRRSVQNPYVEGLAAAARASRRDDGTALLDRLLVAGLIEARSCERFELLACAAEGDLARLYAELGPSERGHALLFVRHAGELFGAAVAEARLDELRGSEARLVASLPFAPRMHSGVL